MAGLPDLRRALPGGAARPGQGCARPQCHGMPAAPRRTGGMQIIAPSFPILIEVATFPPSSETARVCMVLRGACRCLKRDRLADGPGMAGLKLVLNMPSGTRVVA